MAHDPNPYSKSKYDRGRRQSVASRPTVAITQSATNHGLADCWLAISGFIHRPPALAR
jgi:hypothetical protein